MGSSPSSPLPAEFSEALHQAADASGFIGFDTFMRIALYLPEVGYYRREQARVGRHEHSDFFTASSLGPIFGELVVASCLTQLGQRDPAAYHFVEYGAEAGRSVLDGIEHPFARVVTVGNTDHHELTGPCIVFSNELFDAQPCQRWINTPQGWEERGVKLTDDGIRESQRTVATPPAILPESAPPGYQLDLPLAAAALATDLARQSWHGLFLAFDYGKSWRELSEETPQGTVRAYHQHRQNNDLLARLGEQDLTAHVCWDWLSEALQKQEFSVDPVLSQEAFLVKHASDTLARIMQEEATQMSPRKSGLMQLLHPASLGQKFQVLNAWRNETQNSPCPGKG